MTVGLVYDDVFLMHKTPDWHPETPGRLTAIMGALKAPDIWGSLLHIKPRRAGFEDVLLVHTKEYVETLKGFGTGYIDPDTYMSSGTLDAALYAAGAVMSAIEKCKAGEVERAFCAVRPPGHHAEADRAMGFCIFNNVAVGARYAQKTGYEKVFIVDFDVHHGNGTQHIFEEDDTVFYFSTHEYPHYPGTGSAEERGRGKGKGFTFNIPLIPLTSGSGDAEYHRAYHEILPDLMRAFSPDMVFVSAGYDIHTNDPLSSICVSTDGVRDIVRGILSGPDVPYIFCLEGGYNLRALAGSVEATLQEMLLPDIAGARSPLEFLRPL